VWDLLRCIWASPFTPGNIRLTGLWLLDVRAAHFRSRSYGLIDLWLLLNIRAASFTWGNVRLADLRLLNVRAAGFGSRDLSLANGWLRLGQFTASAIRVNPGIVRIHAATNDFVVLMRRSGSCRHGTRAGIGASAGIIARAAHIAVIHATMHAVVALQSAVVNMPIQYAAIWRHVAVDIVYVNVIDTDVRA
jgi:hypothetical protein